MLTERNRKLLVVLGHQGEISTSMANPPVMGLVRAGLATFRYRSEDFNIIAITLAGRAALGEEQT